MFAFKKLGLTRYESILGAGILAIGVLVLLPSIKDNIPDIMLDNPHCHAMAEAETFACTIRQFHDETGRWPSFPHERASLESMAGTIIEETTTPGNESNLNGNAIPLDPWDNPFLVRYIEMKQGDPEEEKSIVVLSKGPNGTLDTVISDLWYQDISKRLMNPGTEQAHLQGDPFGGDDIGFVLSRLDLGGNN